MHLVMSVSLISTLTLDTSPLIGAPYLLTALQFTTKSPPLIVGYVHLQQPTLASPAIALLLVVCAVLLFVQWHVEQSVEIQAVLSLSL